MVSQREFPGTRLRQRAFLAVVPVYVAIPIVWYALNQVRVALYDGDGGPSMAFLVVITIQRYLGWATVALFPLAFGVGVAWAYQQIRARVGR